MATATIEPAEGGSIIQIISKIAQEAGALAPEQKGGVPFAFRGIDAVIKHLSGHLDDHGVVHTSRVLSKETSFRPFFDREGNPNGKGITQTDLLVEYTFWAPDGSFLKTEAAGLAQDHADRSAAQAQSVALRVALLQMFHLPTTDKEPEERGEETQAYIAKEGTSAGPVRAAAPAGPNYQGLIGALIKDEKNGLDGNRANQIMTDVSGASNPAKWTAAHYEKAYPLLKAEAESASE